MKEAIALFEHGYKVTVVYCALSPWADEYDKVLFQQYPGIQWIRAGIHPLQNTWKYRIVRLRMKFYRVLSKFLSSSDPFIAIRSMVLYSQELSAVVQRLEGDLYIGHNLGALPAVVSAAKFYNAPAAFDFEDYHRGEDTEGSDHWRKVVNIENYFTPKLTYATTASPLITETYRHHYPDMPVHTINNCFPRTYQLPLQKLPERPLKLFWFSQFIGPDRGLETVIAAMGRLPAKDIRFTLLGNISPAHQAYLTEICREYNVGKEQLVFMQPVPEREIATIAAGHHIGLACEVPHVINRELCLTNKIFMYLLAGNAILFTDTRAQSSFLEVYPGCGSRYNNQQSEQLAGVLQNYLDDAVLLQRHRERAHAIAAGKLHWEKERDLFLKLVKQTLN